MSKLTYLIILWGGAQQYLINALQIQQLVAARLVCGGSCWRWSRQKLLTSVGWLSVKQLVFYHTVLQAHKIITSHHFIIHCQVITHDPQEAHQKVLEGSFLVQHSSIGLW